MQVPATMASDDPEPGGRPTSRRWGLWLVVLGVALAGLALRAAIPPVIEWNSPHDDEALMGTASAILDGRWLGDWGDHRVNHMTLAKVPGYSIFLAAIHPTGLTPPVAAYLLYLLGALLLTVAARRPLGDRWAGVLFVALALNPAVFGFNFSRVYRDQLATALALLVLGLTAHLLVLLFATSRTSWRRWLLLTVETLGLGATFALLMITRNDIQWILLTVVTLAVGVPIVLRRTLSWRIAVVAILVAAGVAGLAQAGPATVRALNEQYYGVALVNDFSDGEMSRAIRVWASVEVGETTPFILVNRAQRDAVYEASPTARSLGEWLDGQGHGWFTIGCSLQAPSLTNCDDYYGFFAWALRDAAAREGVNGPADLQSVFGRLADEIEEACGSGTLTCGRKSFSVDLPSLDKISVRAVAATFASLIHTSLTRPASPDGVQQDPTGTMVELWKATVNGADTAATLHSSGLQPTSVSMVSAALFLRTLFAWLFVPLTIATLVLLFTRRMWTSTSGQLALACFAGWGLNLATTALFYGASNRNVTGSSPIYIMASQSYLIVGFVLVSALAMSVLKQRATTWVMAAEPRLPVD